MGDDALKAVLFGGALIGTYLLARFARGISDQAITGSRFELHEDGAWNAEPRFMRRPPALVGSEIAFPFDVRELEVKYGPGFWRPNVLNYFFRETDLETGPVNADDFHDELFVDLENPADGYRWMDSFDIVTPKGLARVMSEERLDFVYGMGIIVVQRYDLKTILRAVLEYYVQGEALRRQQDASKGRPEDDAAVH